MDKFKEYVSRTRALLDLWQPQSTLSVVNVPTFLHEPGILTGYRLTNQSWFYYLKSIFHIHNETFNIWTHLIGFFVMWTTLAQCGFIYNLLEDQKSWPILVFGTYCLFAMAIRTFAHIFHTKSYNIHYTVLYMENFDMYLYAVLSAGLAICVYSDEEYEAAYPLPNALLLIHICSDTAALCFHSLAHLTCWITKKYWIIGLFVFHVFHGFLITILVVYGYWVCFNSICSLSLLNYLFVIYLLFLLMGFTYGCHLPELVFPGSFDIFGQSHQIFHIILTTTQILQVHIAYSEIKNREYPHHQGNPDLVVAVVYTCMMVTSQINWSLMFNVYNIDRPDYYN